MSEYPLGTPKQPEQQPKDWKPVPGKPWLEECDGKLRSKLPEEAHKDRPWPFPTGQKP